MITKRHCRICESSNTEVVLDLGHHPLADRFLTPAMLDQPETFYPLRVYLCRECGYTGLTHVVHAHTRYQTDEYSYTASNSPVAVRHFDELASDIAFRHGTLAGQDRLAVDIGGNDGTLLHAIASKTGCRVLNVEASKNMAKLSRENGVPVSDHGLFDDGVSDAIMAERGGADLIVMTNTFNHISDPVGFMRHVAHAMNPGGMLVIEVPSARELLRAAAFDTIYLEHVSIFSLRTLVDTIWGDGAFWIEHAETVPYQGGSLRVYARKGPSEKIPDYVARQIAAEQDETHGPCSAGPWRVLGEQAKRMREALIWELEGYNKRPAIAIGAAAKGNTLLNYCKLDSRLISCVVDSSPHKIGKFTPGSHIPIVGDDDIPADATHAVILPWNIAGHLREKYAARGLEIIVPNLAYRDQA